MAYPYQIKSFEEYKAAYKKSVDSPEEFWADVANNFVWRKGWDKVLEWNFTEPKVEWFKGAKLNITENCIDRHLETLGDKPAIIWEPNNPEERVRTVTYNRLHKRVCQVAQMLINNGVKKGDRVIIYMGMVPELAYAVLGCARIGAIHSVVFGGFSAQSIADRLDDAGAEYIVTCDGAYRGEKIIPLKSVIDDALVGNKTVKRVIVYTRTRTPVSMIKGRDVWWEDEMEYAEALMEAGPPQTPPTEGLSTLQPSPVGDTANGVESLQSGVSAAGSSSVGGGGVEAGSLQSEPRSEGLGNPSVGGGGAVMDAEDPLFILYTSGSTGKPKGVVHTCGGYMVWTAYTFVNTFQYNPGDVFFCTADIGWITGHSYIVYGPLAAGATSVMFEGVPTWPDAGRLWDIIDKHKVNILYTAPTAIRSLMGFGLHPLEGKNLSSLKVLGTVGEPINEEAWHWYDEHIGKKHCPIVDTWWQTETGGILITNLAGITPAKPSWATLPMPGVQPVLIAPPIPQGGSGKARPPQSPKGDLSNAQPTPDDETANEAWSLQSGESAAGSSSVGGGREEAGSPQSGPSQLGKTPPLDGLGEASPLGGRGAGNLCLKAPWPGMLRTTWGDHERCRQTYFSTYPGLYFTGDGALRDEESNYRITGRVDDVLNVSGHRIGTAEVENAINMHSDVVESAVVGYPHDIKGQGIYAYVILQAGRGDEEATRKNILQTVSRIIGPIAKPDKIQFVKGLPKTRSGKIMRRILRKVAEGEMDNFGDITTLLDPGVVEEIAKGKL